LDAHNALAWASALDGTNLNVDATLLFGHRAQDLVADPTLKPALANAHLQVVFDNTAPGAPLPDLVNAFILGNKSQEQELVSISFRATATGTTPTGELANLVVSQTGVLGRTPTPIRDGGFTAEVVDVHTHGNASPPVAPVVAGPTAPVAVTPLPSVHASQASTADPLFTPPLGDPLT
jgi:hypothetical protein